MEIEPSAKIIILFFLHVIPIKLYFVISHKFRKRINNPYYEGIAISVSSFLLCLVTTKYFYIGEEKLYLFVHLPILFIGLIISGIAIAYFYIIKHPKIE